MRCWLYYEITPMRQLDLFILKNVFKISGRKVFEKCNEQWKRRDGYYPVET